MRIALVILHADPGRGGAERYTIDLAAALTRAGHRVSLLATSFAQVPPGVPEVKLNAPGATRKSRYRRMLDSLDKDLHQTSYDIVHAMLPVSRCDVYHPHAGLAVAAIEERKLQAILNTRRRAFASVERELIEEKRPVVVALSDYVKRAIQKHYPMLGDRLMVLFNAVDTDRFHPEAPASRDSVRALTIAQDFQRKGLAQTIEALAQVRDARLRLTVVGKQSPELYQKLSAACGVADRITFAGATSDTRPFYRDADFFVLPTKHDPCSLVVLEALAMGLPVISTKFNGACEIMTDGVHGFVLDDPDDVKALADRMKRMLDPHLRAQMSAACLELRPKLAYEHHLASLLSIYQRAIANRLAKS
ncbi:MAG: glycosyltransferase family 4 protein [Anaerolineae bacterium]|nr:glycosyltransferase family 4 protein [Phycisphaerae bacterium]